MFNDTKKRITRMEMKEGRRGHRRGHKHGGHKHGGHGFRGGFMRGQEGFSRGRKLTSDELQLVLLALLEKSDAHGYELIRAIESRSGGFYVPSPGVIYPGLTYLDEIGYAQAEQDGNRKLHRITDLGRSYLGENRELASEILTRLGQIGERMDNVRAAFIGEDDLPPEERKRFHAMGRVKRALKAKRGCSADEAARIADILNKAADDILGPAQ